MAWARASRETTWRQTKARRLRQMTNARHEAKRNACRKIPSQLSFSQQELIRVQCFMSGYKLTDVVVGTGAYAKVYLAEVNSDKMIKDPEKGDIPLQEIAPQVAVKVISKDLVPVGFLKKFLPRELENHTRISLHPSIVRCFEYFASGDHVFIILEYCKKGDLLDLINTSMTQHGRCFSRDLMKKIFRQICIGVQHLHKEGVVHRDLKCENILLTEEQDAKITDFGFSCRVESDDAILKTSCGSYAYAAPEVIKCIPYNGYKADIWSLGVILFAMANGRLPFKDGLVSDLEDQMKQQALFFNSAVPGECAVLLRRILQYDPERRPDIEAILNDSWMRDKTVRQQNHRLNNRPKWVNSYTVERKGKGSGLQITNTAGKSRDTPHEASTVVPERVTYKPATADGEPMARPATWPRRPILKAGAGRNARSNSRSSSAMMTGYLTVEEERHRLNRTKAQLRSPEASGKTTHLPDCFHNKAQPKNAKPETEITAETSRDGLCGTRNNKLVSLRKEQARRVVILANIYAKPRREALLPRRSPPRHVVSRSDTVKPMNVLPAAKTLYLSPKSELSPPIALAATKFRSMGTLRSRSVASSERGCKVIPAQVVNVTPIIKQTVPQGRELVTPSRPPRERSSPRECGYNQTRSSFLRCQASKAKVQYRSKPGRPVLAVKSTKSNIGVLKATISS